MSTRLSLKKALKTSRLEDFMTQEELRGIGPVDARELMNTIEATIKPKRSKDRTSRSPSRGGSTEK